MLQLEFHVNQHGLKHLHWSTSSRLTAPPQPISRRGAVTSLQCASLAADVYITEIAIAFPSQSFFPLLPNQIILFQLLKSFSFVCNGKVIIFRFVFFIKLI